MPTAEICCVDMYHINQCKAKLSGFTSVEVYYFQLDGSRSSRIVVGVEGVVGSFGFAGVEVYYFQLNGSRSSRIVVGVVGVVG